MDLPKEITNLLPPLMADAVLGINTLHQTPLELSLPAVLGAASLSTHALFNVAPELWRFAPTSLFLTVIARSGHRKSTVSNEVLHGIQKFQDETEIDCSQASYTWEIDCRLWKKAAEDARQNGVAIPSRPLEPSSNDILLTTATKNGLIDRLNSSKHVGLISADAGSFFNSYAFQNSKTGADLEFVAAMSQLWSGETLDRQTGMKDNNISIRDRRFMMMTMLQESLAGFLNNPKYKDQGFIPRTLISVVPEYKTDFVSIVDIGTTYDEIRDGLLAPFNARCYKLLQKVGQTTTKKILEGELGVDPKRLNLPLLKMTDKAKIIVDKFRLDDYTLLDNPIYKEWQTFMDRRYEQALRLAATCAIFNGDTVINENMIQLGIYIIEWYTNQRLTMDLNTGSTNVTVDLAKTVHTWMLNKKVHATHPKGELTARELGQYVPGVFKGMSAPERNSVIAEMLDRGYINQETDGKKQVFTANEI